MTGIFLLFLTSLLVGQLGGINLGSGVVVYIHELILGLLYLGTLPKLLVSKKIVYPKLAVVIIGFVLSGVLSLLVNSARFTPEQLGISSLYLLRFLFYAGIYGVIVQKWIKTNVIAMSLYSFGIAFAALGFVQYFLYPNLRNLVYLGWDPHYYRFVSTLLDPNFAGILLVLTFLLGLHIVSIYKKKLIIAVLECILIVSIYLTYSRSSYLALFCGVVCWILMQKKWKLLFVVVLLVAALFLVPIPGDDTHQLLRVDSSVARVGNWKETLSLISRNPVFGYGFNTLRFVWGKPLMMGGIVTRASSGVDSSLLFVLATTGLVGLGMYGLLFWRMMRINLVIMIVPMVALVVHSIFINSAFYPWVMIWMWTFAGYAEVKK